MIRLEPRMLKYVKCGRCMIPDMNIQVTVVDRIHTEKMAVIAILGQMLLP